MNTSRPNARPASRNNNHMTVFRLIKRLSVTPSLAGMLLLLAACVTPPASKPVVQAPAPAPIPASAPSSAALKPRDYLRVSAFADLPGWGEDDLRQSWPAMLASCDALGKRPEWMEVCKAAALISPVDERGVRAFYESQFIPHQLRNLDGSTQGTMTGYYEPLLRGSRMRTGPYQTALYRVPDDLLTIDFGSLYPDLKNMRLRGRLAGNKVLPYHSRADLIQKNLLAGKELLWVDNPIEAFFLQVQGSGRVKIDGTDETVRVAYADQNGHPYRSIGRYLIDRGELTLEQSSMQGIKAWAAAHPDRQQELLNANPSFVFFREERIADPAKGPKGSLGVPLTPARSIAIDPQFISLGAPVFVATTYPNSSQPLHRLMLAQDTGGAIRNPVRADFFWGFGPEAGESAGRMKQPGQMWVLLPRTMALPPD